MKFVGEIVEYTNAYDVFKLYEDLFLAENERVSIFKEGIQSVALSKIILNAGDKKKSVDRENKYNDVYENKYMIPWSLLPISSF